MLNLKSRPSAYAQPVIYDMEAFTDDLIDVLAKKKGEMLDVEPYNDNSVLVGENLIVSFTPFCDKYVVTDTYEDGNPTYYRDTLEEVANLATAIGFNPSKEKSDTKDFDED